MQKRKEKIPKPIIEEKSLLRIGNAIMLPMPLDWFRAHGFGDTPDEIIEHLKEEKILIFADMDIRIVNPLHKHEATKEFYAALTDVVARAKILPEIKKENG